MRSALLAFAAAAFLSGKAIAQDCSAQPYPTTVCLAFAPISGDVEADKCTIAKLEKAGLEHEFDPTRQRTIADAPLPPHRMILDQLAAAADRVTRDCSDAAALQ